MKNSVILLLPIMLAVILVGLPVRAQNAFPKMVSVTPDTAKAGAELTIEGENLGKEIVTKVYLTDGQHDTETAIVDQSDTVVKVTIPDDAKPGRFSLMILTGGDPPRLIEQPVKVTVEE